MNTIYCAEIPPPAHFLVSKRSCLDHTIPRTLPALETRRLLTDVESPRQQKPARTFIIATMPFLSRMGLKRIPLSIKVSTAIIGIQIVRFVGLLVFAATVTGSQCQTPCPLQGYDGLVIARPFVVAGLTDVLVAAMAVRIVVPFFKGRKGYRRWALLFAGVALGDTAFGFALTVFSEVRPVGVGLETGFGLIIVINLVLLALLLTRSAKEFFVRN